MFTLTDTPVKFVGLLVLFAFATIWSLYQLARRQTGPTLVSNLAHLAMASVMLLMVPRALWQPFSAAIQVPGLVGFFAVLTLWFVYLGIRGFRADNVRRVHAWHALGHAGMFGAMTWHLAAMLVHMPPGGTHPQGHHAGASHSDSMHPSTTGPGGMGLDATVSTPSPLTDTPVGSDPMRAVALAGLPFMIYLLVASIGHLKNAIAPGRGLLDFAGHEAAGHGHYAAGNPRLAALADFAMTFGMFWMSTGVMVPLLPFFSAWEF